MKNKSKVTIIGILLGLISGVTVFILIMNLLILYIRERGLWINYFMTIFAIILIFLICINYKKWKKSIVIILTVILLLSFIIPVRKSSEREIINDTNPPGMVRSRIYYNRNIGCLL